MEVIFKDVDVSIGDSQILHHVSGMARPGEMLAVMGPSGAGKSTLLNTISGRMPCDAGSVLLNGKPMTHKMRRQICYVLQRDEFFPSLTLRQTLTFTAMLRLPDKMPKKKKMQRVEETIDLLDLRKCANTAMGGIFLTGLSGGERKRASIACEIITNPSLIMLDEPTSGLDSAIAYSLMKQMKSYTEISNKTVIATIHQPSSQIFHMFDNILLLANGRVAYYGRSCQIIDFFSSLSLHCTLNWNPADFILEKVKESEEVLNKIIKAADAKRYEPDWPPELAPDTAAPDVEGPSEIKVEVIDGAAPFKVLQTEEKDEATVTSHLIVKHDLSKVQSNGDVSVKINGLITENEQTSDEEQTFESYYVEGAKWQTSFLTQYATLTHRCFCQAKSRILSKLNIIQTFVLAFVCGFIWFQTPRTEATLKDRNGLIFFLVVYLGFMAMFDIITSFPEERSVITRERAAGAYRLSAYYLSKMTSEAPLLFILPCTMLTIAYWLGGLTIAAGSFFAMLTLILFHAIVSQSFGIVIGVTFLDFKTSITTGATFMLCSLLAGGFYQTHFPAWMEWARYVSYLQYTFHACLKIEYLLGPPILCSAPGESVFEACNLNQTSTITGEEYLAHSHIDRPIYADILTLFGLLVSMRLLGYVILRFIRRPGGIRR